MASLLYRLKNDPENYENEFQSRFIRLKENMNSFQTSITRRDEELMKLLDFVSLAISHYPTYVPEFQTEIISILRNNAASMHPEIRMSFLKALMRLTDRNLIPLSSAFQVFFNLFRIQEKELRKSIRNFLVHSVKRVNQKGKNVKLNTELQNYMQNLLQDKNPLICREAVILLVEMYRRQVWKNERTVNFIADALQCKSSKVMATALFFFLGKDKEAVKDDDSSDEDVEDGVKMKRLKTGHRVGKHTRRREKQLKRSLTNVKKKRKRREEIEQEMQCNLSAIHMLYDSQKVADKLLQTVQSTQERFELRLKMMELISKLIGVHQLLVIPFYPLLQRFMRPQQRDATHFLLFAAHASHDQVPPDVIGPLVRTIADNFVTDRASSEAIAVGLNTLRELASRCPYAIEEDLLGDLIQYTSYRDKNVTAAARSLVRLYREINPKMLPRKYRGVPIQKKDTENADGEESELVLPLKVARHYGEDMTVSYLHGAELLAGQSAPEESSTKPEGAGSDWESCSSEDEEIKDDDDNEGWVDVEHSSDDDESPDAQEPVMSEQERAKRAIDVLSSRLLTEEEFDTLRKHQKKMKQTTQVDRKRKSATIDVDEYEEDDETTGKGDSLPTMSKITKLVKRPKSDKTDRMESIKDGRTDKSKYAYKVKRQNPHASTTNKEKRKKKPFQMVRPKMKKKQINASFKEKQIRLKKHLQQILRH